MTLSLEQTIALFWQNLQVCLVDVRHQDVSQVPPMGCRGEWGRHRSQVLWAGK